MTALVTYHFSTCSVHIIWVHDHISTIGVVVIKLIISEFLLMNKESHYHN